MGRAVYVVFLVVLLQTLAIADLSLYNSNCPDFARALGKGCNINNDCTEVKCTEKSLGDKELSLTIKINKCEDPVTVDITVKAFGFSWKTSFESSKKVAIPGLSIKPFGSLVAAGVYLQVDLKDTGSNLQLKIIILTGIEFLGSFKQFTEDTLVNSDLPIGTHECGIKRWWKSLGNLQYLVIAGAIVFVIVLIVCCWCCCCRKTTPRGGGGRVLAPAPTAAFIAPMPMNNPTYTGPHFAMQNMNPAR